MSREPGDQSPLKPKPTHQMEPGMLPAPPEPIQKAKPNERMMSLKLPEVGDSQSAQRHPSRYFCRVMLHLCNERDPKRPEPEKGRTEAIFDQHLAIQKNKAE